MDNEWQVTEGTGWIEIGHFGSINPRRDNVAGGRQYFTAKTADGGYAKAIGASITNGPETWSFEFDEPFYLGDGDDRCVEVAISPVEGGRYAVKFRQGEWPTPPAGGGW